jgi:hypothetical protein
MVRMFFRSHEEIGKGRRVLARRIGKVWTHRVPWTDSCSGCAELGECMGNAHLYPYDSKTHCRIGAGCDECGYTGKRCRIEVLPILKSEQRELNTRLRALMKRSLAA